MFSSKRVNKGVVEMYKDKPYIETTITLYTPLEKEDELYRNLNLHISAIEPTMAGLNNDVENIIMNTFESDVAVIQSNVKNLFK